MNVGLLREHDFRQLFAADTISQVGTQVTLLALPLVAIVALNATPFEVGLLAAAETVATSGRASSVTCVPTWLIVSAAKSWRKSCSRSSPTFITERASVSD
jgi:hypothetical protein